MRRHSRDGTAYVSVNGEQIQLGAWGSQEAARAYRRVISAWEREHGADPTPVIAVPTIADLIAAFMSHAAVHYRRADGSQTDEVRAFRKSLQPVLARHGEESPDDFEPADLENVMSDWVRAGHARETINKMAGRVKHVWAWGCPKRLVGAAAAGALRTVRGLQSGRTPAQDYEEVQPAPIRDIAAVLRYCKRHRSTGWDKWGIVEAMIRTNYLCGARQSEVLTMRGDEIHRTSIRVARRTLAIPAGAWCFVPTLHKTRSKGKFVRYLIGPRLQRILQPWIDQAGGGYLFPGKEKPHWNNGTWNDAIEFACREMGANKWTPGQLRHSYLTRISHQYGIAAASEAVSHAHLQTTAVYVERDLKLSAEIAMRHG